MKRFIFLLSLIFTLFISCTKNDAARQIIPIPNGNFQSWTSAPVLTEWKSNSCPLCLGPLEMYIVRQTTDAAGGQYAAMLIFKGTRAMVSNKFAVNAHPTTLECYLRSDIENGDTARINIDVYSGNHITDSGEWLETSSSTVYRKVSIPLSQFSSLADSVSVKITGGGKGNTKFYVDDFVMVK